MVQWDYRPFWEETIRQIQSEIGEGAAFWFNSLGYLGDSEAGVRIAVPSAFFQTMFQSRYHGRVEQRLRELTGRAVTVTLEVAVVTPAAITPAVVTPAAGPAAAPPGAGEAAGTRPVFPAASARPGSGGGVDAGTGGDASRLAAGDAEPAYSRVPGTDSPAPLPGQAGSTRPTATTFGQTTPTRPNPTTFGQTTPTRPTATTPSQTAAPPRPPAAAPDPAVIPHPPATTPGQTVTTRPVVAGVVKKHTQLQGEYTFDTFVVGMDNAFAYNAASAVARNPGNSRDYNPLLIYGGVGLGKTHLMQAIGHYIHGGSDLKVLYITAQGFMTDYVDMVGQKAMSDFRKKYRYVDVLLMDDIHTLTKGDQTQEELFYTFEALYGARKQLVFTCDRPISEVKQMTDRLKSRFKWGLAVDLKPPNYETRIAICRKKLETRSVAIPPDVIDLIARNVSSNVRDLEGALNKLSAYADLLKTPITMEIAQRELRDLFSAPSEANLSVDTIQRAAADYFSLSPADLKGKKKTKGVVRARHIAMYLVRTLTEYSNDEIGQFFGGRDHSTVIHACDKITAALSTDTDLYSTVEELKRVVKEQGTRK